MSTSEILHPASEATYRRAPRAIDVAKLWRSHGQDAVFERWGWISGRTLYKLRQRGDRLLAQGRH